MLKIEREASVNKTRELIVKIKNHFETFSDYKSIRIAIDVDPL